MFTEKDLISAENYISIADFAITESTNALRAHKSRLDRFPSQLFRKAYICTLGKVSSVERMELMFPQRDEVIFFIKTDFLNHFVLHIRPYLKQKYKIITGYSDYTIPSGGAGNFRALLNDNLLVGWYGYNIIMDHPKLKPIPLGIPPKLWLELGRQAGNHELFIRQLSKFLQKPMQYKKKLIYWGSLGDTNSSRRDVYNIVRKMEIATITGRRDYKDYLNDLKQHKFAICPEGNGIDTHRIWESIYFQAIPIIKKNAYMNSYKKDFSILYVNDWSELIDFTDDFLNEKFQKMTNKNHKDRSRFKYWENIIKGDLR
jgi:hypothetical protein